MVCVFTLNGIDLTDESKYRWKIERDRPNREVERTTKDCGGGAGGGVSVSRDRITYITRPMSILCMPAGGSYQAALNEADAIIAAIKTGIAFETKDTGSADWDGSAVHMVLQLHDQTTPTVWTVKGGQWADDRWDIRAGQKIMLQVELDLVEGAEFVDAGTGLPISGASPGVFTSAAATIVYSDTGTAKIVGGETFTSAAATFVG